VIFKQILEIRSKDRETALILVIAWVTIFLNNFISGDGIIFYKPFWLFASLNFLALEKLTEV
jgi:hypothetical protein